MVLFGHDMFLSECDRFLLGNGMCLFEDDVLFLEML